MLKQEIGCPFCKRPNGFHTPCTPETGLHPQDGSWSVCWGCREVSVFRDSPNGLVLVRPDPEEAEEMDRSSDLKLARGVLAESYRPSEAIQFFLRHLHQKEREPDGPTP